MTPLFEHQERAVEFLVKNRGIGALYMDMGTGKTRCALEVFAYLRIDNPGLKMVVICPLSLIESAWADDIAKFTGFTYYNAHDDQLPESAPISEDILLINYEATIQKKNQHITRHIKDNLLVIDESSRMKNHTSKTTKTILSFKDLPKFKIIMSGTPAPNTPLEYWAQMEFLRDWTLHKSFFAFRNSYFHLQRGKQIMDIQRGQMITRDMMRGIMEKGWKYEITPQSMTGLMERIKPLVFWAKKGECLSLPEQLDEIRKVELGDKQRRHYKEMKDDLITEIRNTPITAQVALAKIMKLREITSGFAIDTLSGREIDIGESPKLKELNEVIEEAGNQQQIIWACFKWDITKICALLQERHGEGCYRTLYSGTRDHQASINEFKGGEARFLVANPHSAAHGLTFTNCSLETFFSLDYSWEYYEQAKARIHRAGQINKCTYVHLIAKDTIDEQVLKCLREKGDINQIAYEMMR
jgi:SNF2 family DNA or RNA helicase